MFLSTLPDEIARCFRFRKKERFLSREKRYSLGHVVVCSRQAEESAANGMAPYFTGDPGEREANRFVEGQFRHRSNARSRLWQYHRRIDLVGSHAIGIVDISPHRVWLVIRDPRPFRRPCALLDRSPIWLAMPSATKSTSPNLCWPTKYYCALSTGSNFRLVIQTWPGPVRRTPKLISSACGGTSRTIS